MTVGRRFIMFLAVVVVVVILQGAGQSHAVRSTSSSLCQSEVGFVKTSGTHFVRNDKKLYLNGFNSYWMMYMASDPSTKSKVTSTLQEASSYGMNVARTWAFSDGGHDRPLQSSPGVYNEDVFKGLDFVISEAGKHRIYLILSLVNNWEAYGGKKQYVQWARDQGQYINNDDDFFTNALVKEFYKNHVKTVLSRVNTFTGVSYKNDPTIFSWELMNEPRCLSDLSGKSLQDWVTEMATHVKSIDTNHLLEIGLEGFYGDDKKQNNPAGTEVGTNFVRNNQIYGIDFTTIHLYPESWLPNSNDTIQDAFVDEWIRTHIEDSNTLLKKPILLTEFAKSSKSQGFTVAARDKYFTNIYNTMYNCARSGGACGGELFWQVLATGMESFGDGNEVVLEASPSTDAIIAQQSQKLSNLD